MLAYNHIKELLPFLTYSGKCSEFYQAYPCVTNVAIVAPQGSPMGGILSKLLFFGELSYQNLPNQINGSY